MIKTIKKTVKQDIRYCDICGEESPGICGRLDNCIVCNRDICDKHSLLTPDFNTYEDYPVHICTDCMPIARPFYKNIEMLKKECNKEESQIRDEMQAACLKNLKAKK